MSRLFLFTFIRSRAIVLYCQLGSDAQETIDTILWTLTGKVKRMEFANGDYVEFDYDPLGNRIAKLHYDDGTGITTQTLYIHDASGNTLAVYEYVDDGVTETFDLLENHLYSGKRMGVHNRGVDMIPAYTAADTMNRILGNHRYELTNHLGNVLEVISDRRLTESQTVNNLCFTGTNGEYAQATFDASLNEEMTIEFWVKPTFNASFHPYASYIAPGLGMFAGADDGHAAIYAANSSASLVSIQGTSNIADGNWHHVVAVSKDGYWAIYVDGEQEIELYDDPGDFVAMNSTPFMLGANPSYFANDPDGCVKEVSLWNFAKEEVDIAIEHANYYNGYTGSETGLVGYWKVNDGTDIYVNDLATVPHNLTLSSSPAPVWGDDDVFAYYNADVKQYTDYTPYGVQMEGRNGGDDFRYGFQGQEEDDEIKGDGNSYYTHFRIYDPRIGRWISLDPKQSKYPNQTPFASYNNNPIVFIDPYGDDPPKGGGFLGFVWAYVTHNTNEFRAKNYAYSLGIDESFIYKVDDFTTIVINSQIVAHRTRYVMFEGQGMYVYDIDQPIYVNTYSIFREDRRGDKWGSFDNDDMNLSQEEFDAMVASGDIHSEAVVDAPGPGAISKTVQGVNIIRAGSQGIQAYSFIGRGSAQLMKMSSVAAEYGIGTYKELKKVVAGTGLQVHHLIEKRFAKIWGEKANEMKSIVLTAEEHQKFTNAWREAIPYTNSGAIINTSNVTKEFLIETAREIYKDYPLILETLGI